MDNLDWMGGLACVWFAPGSKWSESIYMAGASALAPLWKPAYLQAESVFCSPTRCVPVSDTQELSHF